MCCLAALVHKSASMNTYFRAAVKGDLMLMFDEYKTLRHEASQQVDAVAKLTELDYAPQLSIRHNNKIWLKREDQQSVFSYKIRGAYNLNASLSKEEQGLGVSTSSAGTHAPGVALAAHP